MTKIIGAYVCTAAFLLLPGVCRAVRTVPYEPEFYEVSDAVVTPHIAWAKPITGTPVRALLIAPWFCHRETVELEQRFELEATPMMTTTRRALGYEVQRVRSWAYVTGLFRNEREQDLRRKLDGDYDVYVVGSDWKALPLWARYTILKRVKNGAGLFLGYRQGAKYLDKVLALDCKDDTAGVAAGLPWKQAANLDNYGKETPLFRAVTFGKGRVLMFMYPSDPVCRRYLTPREDVRSTRMDYEIAQALAIRAMLWCARRKLPVRLQTPQAWRWNWKTPPKSLSLAVSSATPVWQGTVETVWYDADGYELARCRTPFRTGTDPAAATKVDVPAPADLPAGTAYAVVRVLIDDRVAGFACFRTTVDGTDFAAVAFARERFPSDTSIDVRLRLTGPPGKDTELRWGVRDAYGRILDTQSKPWPANAAEMGISQVLPPPRCAWHRLDLELRVAGRRAARARAEFFRAWRPADDEFQLVAWYGPARDSYEDSLIQRAFANAGINVVYPSHIWGKDGARRSTDAVRAGMSLLPYICSVRTDTSPPPAGADPHARRPPVTDPEYRKRLQEQVTDSARQFRPMSPVGYSLGDENYFAGGRAEYCSAPSSVAYFRRWLRKRYGDVAALNRAWGTQLTAFEDAQPIWLADARAQKAAAHWIDFRLCMEDSWTGIFASLADTIHRIDPEAKVGHEGSGRLDSFGAFDWYGMLRGINLFVPYPSRPAGGNLVRSFHKPGTMSSYWYGSYTFRRRLTVQRYFPWFSLFQSFNSAWYFNTYGHASMAHEVGFAPDLRPLPHFVETARNARIIRGGFDKLLLNAVRENDGIAVYYSPAAIHANTFWDRSASHDAVLNALGALLNDIGLQYEYVSDAQVAAGILDKKRFRLLILPLAQAMDAAQAQAVRRFQLQGGTLLADLPPAVENAHAGPWAKQPLATIFGVQPAGAQQTVLPPKSPVLDLDKQRLPCQGILLGNAKMPPDFTPMGRIDATPVLLRSPQKRAALLNFAFGGYLGVRKARDGATLRRALSQLLAELGVRPAVRVLDADAQPLPNVMTVRFTRGNATFLGIMPGDDRSTDERTILADLRLPEHAHLYDMRRGRYLGPVDRTVVTLTTCRAELFALLPHPVLPPRIDAAEFADAAPFGRRVQVRGRLLRADSKGLSKTAHAVRIELLPPDGRREPWLRRKLLVDNGTFHAELLLPPDAPTGGWTLEVTDIDTGFTTRHWMKRP
ncbi:MAG: hypothetical protein GXP31_10455 [Kiritimatiellaeota bacterium]|nr:hypothetical protein [Kiritimatiellota bacterium]